MYWLYLPCSWQNIWLSVTLTFWFWLVSSVARSCGYVWSTAVEDLCRTSTTVSFTLRLLEYFHPKHDTVSVCHVIPVTGPLSELQIAYVCRETLQVFALLFFNISSSWDFQSGFLKLWIILYRVWDICTAWARCTATLRYHSVYCLATFSTLQNSLTVKCEVSRAEDLTFLPRAVFLTSRVWCEVTVAHSLSGSP